MKLTLFKECFVLYSDDKFILIQNKNTGEYSFGLKSDFGTFLGFPVDQSCLTVSEAKEILTDFIEIDAAYLVPLGHVAQENIVRWSCMLDAITKADKSSDLCRKEYIK